MTEKKLPETDSEVESELDPEAESEKLDEEKMLDLLNTARQASKAKEELIGGQPDLLSTLAEMSPEGRADFAAGLDPYMSPETKLDEDPN